ncbi:MAG: SMC-Scp complex subunit ScpB [Ruminococcaceae bacterium]|nr:SMC-Scp complex subunit ScpB [Oscillospiraceae bacterium]
MSELNIKNAIEAILFASGSSVSVSRMAQALEISEKETKKQADMLMEEYTSANRGITIIRLDDSYQMVSAEEYAPQIRTVMDLRRNTPLSQAAMEVLAVVAYNQPVTKAFVEQVRGVDCSGVIGSLTAKDLIEEKGRLELPGRPLVYGTTENFLRCFGISDLSELPEIPATDKESGENTDGDDAQLSVFSSENEAEAETHAPQDAMIAASVGEIIEEATKPEESED